MTLGGVCSHGSHQLCAPSTSRTFSTSPATLRAMKRHLQSPQGEAELEMGPERKRRIYEERMSRKLWNFHINDGRGEAQQSYGNPATVEELQDGGIADEMGMRDSPDALIEEPLLEDESSGGIVLSDQLKSYIDSCKKRDDFVYLKNRSKTGMELVLYRQPLTVSETSNDNGCAEDDIHNRICELEDWIETDDEDLSYLVNQVVSFPPDSSVSGNGSINGSGSRASSPSPPSPSNYVDSGINSIDSLPLSNPNCPSANLFTITTVPPAMDEDDSTMTSAIDKTSVDEMEID